VDPQEEVVSVFKLRASKYVKHGAWKRGGMATSALLPGLEIDVTKVFEAAEGQQPG
jgi:hypothetical protein